MNLTEKLVSQDFKRYFYKCCKNIRLDNQHYEDAYQEFCSRCFINKRMINIPGFLRRFKFFAHGGVRSSDKGEHYIKPIRADIEDVRIPIPPDSFERAELSLALKKLEKGEIYGIYQYLQGTVYQNWIEEAKPGVLKLRDLLGTDSSS